ncbi:hypothetical protein [uncultured Lacinutrix sp.]|uniref:hypothetical protein n=1 Tax=uncultured Lacinutrix sp. TaxID=574032 RepID=UPI002612A63A|nr:hypothetical protein [uncultured Lacinutrix sp.]
MKKLLIPFIVLFISANTFAQRLNKDKVKALKIAHITEELNLTEKEAQAFWPIYNANEEARIKLKENSGLKRTKSIDDLTEDEAKSHLEGIIKMEYKKQELYHSYLFKLSKILSAKKILKLMKADRSFRQKMIKEFKD